MANVTAPDWYTSMGSTYTQSGSEKVQEKTGTSDKDLFLKLMITQLQYQDPLNPQDDQQFLAQMAQFTTLEQIQSLNKTQSISYANSLMGKLVLGSVYDRTDNESKLVLGVVDGIRLISGEVYVSVDGVDVELSKIEAITEEISAEDASNKNLLEALEKLGKSIDEINSKIRKLEGEEDIEDVEGTDTEDDIDETDGTSETDDEGN